MAKTANTNTADANTADATAATDSAAAAVVPVDAAAPVLPTRIAPQLDSDGNAIELNPPCAGLWLREADGGLVPRDEDTALAAGLAWPA